MLTAAGQSSWSFDDKTMSPTFYQGFTDHSFDTHIFAVHDSVRRALTEIKSPGFYDCEASNGISVITKGVKITRPNTLRKYTDVMTHII